LFTVSLAALLDDGDIDLLIGIIASKARFASPPPAASASVSARGVICQERPQRSLHQPHWLSCRHCDDRVPVTVRLFLILRRDLKEKASCA